MIWVTLRQHRPQILVTVLLLFVLGAFLLVHGLLTVSVRAEVAAAELEDVLGNWFRFAYQGLSWMPMFPLLIGVFGVRRCWPASSSAGRIGWRGPSP